MEHIAAELFHKGKALAVELHNAIGFGDWYPEYPRRIYGKVEGDNPIKEPHFVLQLAITSMQNTAFRLNPQIPIFPKELPGNAGRMNTLHEFRK